MFGYSKQPSINELVNMILNETLIKRAETTIEDIQGTPFRVRYEYEDSSSCMNLPEEISGQILGEMRKRAKISYQNGQGQLYYDDCCFTVVSIYDANGGTVTIK